MAIRLKLYRAEGYTLGMVKIDEDWSLEEGFSEKETRKCLIGHFEFLLL